MKVLLKVLWECFRKCIIESFIQNWGGVGATQSCKQNGSPESFTDLNTLARPFYNQPLFDLRARAGHLPKSRYLIKVMSCDKCSVSRFFAELWNAMIEALSNLWSYVIREEKIP